MSDTGLSPWHGLSFGVMNSMLMTIDFGGVHTWWAWTIAALAFFPAELHGALSKSRKIDTWSQIVWAFLKKGPARIPVVLGWVGWVTFLLLELVGPTPTFWGFEAGAVCIVLGVAAWLLPHFLFRGKFG